MSGRIMSGLIASSMQTVQVNADGTGFSLSQLLTQLTAAYAGQRVRFICAPGTFTEAVILNDNHSLHFLTGNFLNTVSTAIPPPITVGDNARVTGSAGHLFYESNVSGCTALIWTQDGASNVMIRNMQFKGHVANADPGGLAGIWLLNAQNSRVENCTFDGCHNYNAVIGKYPGEPGLSTGCVIRGNTFTGVKTQNIAVTCGINWQITDNILDYQTAPDPGPFFVPIDIEPNDFTDVISDFTIANNTINVTGSVDYSIGIALQGDIAQSGMPRGVVRDNVLVSLDDLSDIVSHCQRLLTASGCDDLMVSGNSCIGTYAIPFVISNSRDVTLLNNTMLQNDGGFRLGMASSTITGNMMSNTYPVPGGVDCTSVESESQVEATSAGSVITAGAPIDGSYWKFKPFHTGLLVVFNANVYTINTVDVSVYPTTATMTTSVGTITNKTFASGDVTIATGNINIPSHGFNTGARVLPTTTGVLPVNAGLVASAVTFVIKIDNNNIKLATTLADALAGTAMVYSGAGSGVNTLASILLTQFSSNVYSGNSIPQGITLNPNGTSVIA